MATTRESRVGTGDDGRRYAVTLTITQNTPAYTLEGVVRVPGGVGVATLPDGTVLTFVSDGVFRHPHTGVSITLDPR